MRGKRASQARAVGQAIEATVFVGKEGVTDGNAAEVAAQLKGRPLVKVRVAQEAAGAGSRKALAQELATRAGAELVEVRGRTVLLARRPRGGLR